MDVRKSQREAIVSELKVVLVHNRYQQAGGEDDVFAAEQVLLRSRGHEVVTYTADNRDVDGMGSLALAGKTLWNNAAYREIRAICGGGRAQVAHFHNFFPLISPAAYYGARAEGAIVVQTLHNFRLICPGASLYRDGQPCELCIGKVPWPSVVHKCYRGHRAATTVTASLLVSHRLMRTWRRTVNVYIALTEFARRKFIDGGLPAEKIVVKPNFLAHDPGTGDHAGGYALFVGRLTQEKGVGTLLDAWARMGVRIPLKIAGTGPLEGMRTDPNVEWLGWQSSDQVLTLMKNAAFLVLCSGYYEGCPMTLLQAFATGLPVIVTGHGSIGELVDDGRTGRHFRPGMAGS